MPPRASSAQGEEQCGYSSTSRSSGSRVPDQETPVSWDLFYLTKEGMEAHLQLKDATVEERSPGNGSRPVVSIGALAKVFALLDRVRRSFLSIMFDETSRTYLRGGPSPVSQC